MGLGSMLFYDRDTKSIIEELLSFGGFNPVFGSVKLYDYYGTWASWVGLYL